MRPQPHARKPRGKAGRASGLAGVSVLVVEDDAASRKLQALLLAQAGAKVTAVASAEEALSALSTVRPRLIVLDLILSRMGGLAFAEQVKADPATRDLVIVAVSSLGGEEVAQVALSAGCAAYIKKPIDTSKFADQVSRILGEEQ